VIEQIGTRFRQAVARFVENNDIPMVRFKKGIRKIDVMRPLLARAARSGRPQVVAVGWAQEFQHVYVPRPLRRGVLRGCASRIFTASMAFTVNSPARLSPNVQRRGRLRCTLRTAQLLPPPWPSTLGSGLARFQARPPACYRAPWRLPGPDFHRQATTSFRSGHNRWTITS
jgi:hypothetical protein